jgi:hypothetical protein
MTDNQRSFVRSKIVADDSRSVVTFDDMRR